MIVERQLRSEQTREVSLCYMDNVSLLVTSIGQQTLQQWLSKSLQTGLQSPADMIRMLQSVAAALQSCDINNGQQSSLASALETIHDMVPMEEADLQHQYLVTAASLPVTVLERLTSPSVWWEVSQAKLARSAALRAQVAISAGTDTPLTWFNEIIEAAGKQSGDHGYILRHLVRVLTKCRAEKSRHLISGWLLELMGQVSSILRSANIHSFIN